MAHSDWLDPIGASLACPLPMTRAALIVLRNAGELRPECPYVVTDHVQNRLVAGTLITLRATDTGKLSEQVEVSTTYDNEAWAGLYDIDRALVLQLTDNRNNTARGPNGTEVANFDWGNPAYDGNHVEDANLVVTYGNAAVVKSNRVFGAGATLNLTGFSGTFQYNQVHTAASVNFTGANGLWRYNEFKNGGSFSAAGYTGGGDNFYNEFDISNVTFAGMTGLLALQTNEVVASSINVTGAAAFTFRNNNLTGANVARPVGAGVGSITNTDSPNGCVISHTGAGAMTISGSEINGNVTLGGAGNLTFANGVVESAALFRNFGLGSLAATRTNLRGTNSQVLVDAGSNKTVTVNGSTVESSGSVRVIGAVAGGAFNVTDSRVSSSAFVFHRGTGQFDLIQSSVEALSGIDVQSGDRSYNVSRTDVKQTTRCTFTGTGAVTDIIESCDFSARAQLTISCSGAANTLNHSSASGMRGVITFAGTTGGQVVTRVRAKDATIAFTNSTANQAAENISANDGGTVSFTGAATAKIVRNVSTHSGGLITVGNTTGGGIVELCAVLSGGQLNLSGPAAGVVGVTVTRGVLTVNGGSLSSADKSGTGILTTGNFAHANISYASAANQTLTAANTGRARDYFNNTLI